MIISRYNSEKLKVLSFVSILFVIFIHSPYVEAKAYPLASSVQTFMTDFGLAIFAVPMFYFISGMLFFKGVESAKECFPKIRKRVRTLLVPYVIWNIVFVLWYVAMAVLPGISQYVNSDMLTSLNWRDPVGTFSFLFVEPAGFHLWFLRDLMLFVVVSPLLYVVMKRWPWLSLLVAFFALGWIPRMGITYFMLGGIIAMHHDMETLDKVLTRPVVGGCLAIYLLNAVVTVVVGTFPGNALWQYVEQLVAVAAIMGIWGLYSWVVKREFLLSDFWIRVMSFTFFVYLFHEPVFNIVKKLGLKVLGESDASLIGLFLINPFIIIILSILVGMAFRKMLPKVYAVFVGGR